MRVAYVTHYFPPATFAAAINTYRIVKGLLERGHEISVFSPRTYSPYTASLSEETTRWPSQLNVYRSPHTPLILSTTIPYIFCILKALKCQCDLTITQFHLFHMASFTGLPLKVLRGRPWIVKIHDMIPDSSLPAPILEKIFEAACYGFFFRNIGKKADKLWVLTKELRSLLVENGCALDKIAVIPHGVDVKKFSPSVSKSSFMDKKNILYTGSMMPEDGLDYLVRAFSILNKKEELNLVLVGDGPQRLKLMQLVKVLDLEHRVTFYRRVPHDLIPNFIKRAYITVGPLRFSPLNNYTIPTKLLEYFACGKPVVCSPVSKDILMNGFNGFVVKEITPENIAKKFSALLDDEKLASKMGRNARQLVVERFDWEKIITQIEKEIEEVGSL